MPFSAWSTSDQGPGSVSRRPPNGESWNGSRSRKRPTSGEFSSLAARSSWCHCPSPLAKSPKSSPAHRCRRRPKKPGSANSTSWSAPIACSRHRSTSRSLCSRHRRSRCFAACPHQLRGKPGWASRYGASEIPRHLASFQADVFRVATRMVSGDVANTARGRTRQSPGRRLGHRG